MEPVRTNVSEHAELEIHERHYTGKQDEPAEVLDALGVESQAGLRQYSLERMTGYGLNYADAVEFRARIVSGEPWREAAEALAQDALAAAERTDPPASDATRMQLYHRASALLRMSQSLMLEDNGLRRDIVRRAVECYSKAVDLGLPREHVHLETPGGRMSGWLVPARDPIGSVVAIGGVEGWAMDFDIAGDSLAARGIDTLLLDAPGQGETRILNRHYLTPEWMESLRKAIDYLEQRAPGRPIGFIGNSMGGGIAIAMTNNDRRIAACINNGGIIKPSLARMAGPTFFMKMIAFCGIEGSNLEDRAAAIWDSVEPVKPGPNTDYSLLVVQGGRDPLVADDHGKMFMAATPAGEKTMEYFSDGIHCIYNHLQDRDIVMADWMRARLLDATSR